MEKFWAVILIFVIVAAAGLMYVNQVYNPQKETQMAMAETANETLSAVKLEMGNDTTPSVVNASSVKHTVEMYCSTEGNEVSITVETKDLTETYRDDSEGIDAQLNGVTNMFLKTPYRDADGKLTSISFSIIED